MARLKQTQRKSVGSTPRLPVEIIAAIAAEKKYLKLKRRGVEVRIIEEPYDEDEIVIEDDDAGVEDEVDDNATTGEEITTLELKFYLLNAESKPVLIELGKKCANNIVLNVYHVIVPTDESNMERDCSDDEFVEIRKSSREEKKKMDEHEREANLNEMYESDEDSELDKGFYCGESDE
ncbi:hypothetical protein AgCh_005279 [Apium graveolens]